MERAKALLIEFNEIVAQQNELHADLKKEVFESLRTVYGRCFGMFAGK